MAKARWMMYTLFCPVCNDYFKELVVIYKVPKNFDIEPHLAGMVERHDHNAFQEAKAQMERARVESPENPE